MIWCFRWIYTDDQLFSFSNTILNLPFIWKLFDSLKSDWAFYLIFTRAWELLAGSICAWVMLKNKDVSIPRFAKYVALLIIFITCFVNFNQQHPSIESLLVVFCTAVILLGNDEWLPINLLTRASEKIGDWSYSIYLVHWPFFAFAFLAYVGNVPVIVSFILIPITFYFGYLQYKFIEMPFRNGSFKKVFSNWRVVLSCTLILILIPATAGFSKFGSFDEFDHIRRPNRGLHAECDGSFDILGTLKSTCMHGVNAKLAIWGDSYAMHLVPGLVIKNADLVQITKNSCGPFLGLSQFNAKYNNTWAKSCIDFNNNALSYLQSHRDITHVILSTNLNTYIQSSGSFYYIENGDVTQEHNVPLDSFKKTISEIKKLGMTPIVFSPPPKVGFDIGECLERQKGPAILFRENCVVGYEKYYLYQKEVNEFLREIESVANIVWLEDYLCQGNKCKVIDDEIFLYRDDGHLAVEGSIKILGNTKITDL